MPLEKINTDLKTQTIRCVIPCGSSDLQKCFYFYTSKIKPMTNQLHNMQASLKVIECSMSSRDVQTICSTILLLTPLPPPIQQSLKDGFEFCMYVQLQARQ